LPLTLYGRSRIEFYHIDVNINVHSIMVYYWGRDIGRDKDTDHNQGLSDGLPM
jgi:hypothetical protein